MKLLTRTSVYIVTFSLVVFFLTGVAIYKVLRTMSEKEINQELQQARQQVTSLLDRVQDLEHTSLVTCDRTDIGELRPGQPLPDRLFDTVFYDAAGSRFLPFRALAFSRPAGDGFRQIMIYRSLTPTNELIERITLFLTILFLVFLGGIYLLNRYMFGSVWADFFRTLGKVRSYHPEAGPLKLESSGIEEFDEMNHVLDRMSQRITLDYQNLKEYTSNLSHEFQTPLAAIRTRVERLLQEEGLTEQQVQMIHSIYAHADQLSRLGQALTLLTKIENDQFPGEEEVRLGGRIRYHAAQIEDRIQMRGISLTLDINEEPVIRMNPSLVDLMLVNLLKNAVNHNLENGQIRVVVHAHELVISNTGEPLHVDPGQMFKRFTRGKERSSGLGLGLPMVKRICDAHGIDLQYSVQGEWHTVRMKWEDPQSRD